jgi:hypothetical protein
MSPIADHRTQNDDGDDQHNRDEAGVNDLVNVKKTLNAQRPTSKSETHDAVLSRISVKLICLRKDYGMAGT